MAVLIVRYDDNLNLFQNDGQFGQSTYGVCFVDTTIGKFQVQVFLRTMIFMKIYMDR